MIDYLQQMGIGYLLTISIETPILMICLSSRHTLRRRLLAGVWLSACTYPFVWLVFPALLPDRQFYLWGGGNFRAA